MHNMFRNNMMKFSLVAVIAVSLYACGGNDVKTLPNADKIVTDSANFTTIQWTDSIIQLGTIKPDSKTDITFHFTNTGDKPLYIISARPGCGCTVADYPKEAVAPGKGGDIKAVFNSKNKPNEAFYKNILVTANTKPSTLSYLYFKGTIGNPNDSTARATDTSLDKTAEAIKNLNK